MQHDEHYQKGKSVNEVQVQKQFGWIVDGGTDHDWVNAKQSGRQTKHGGIQAVGDVDALLNKSQHGWIQWRKAKTKQEYERTKQIHSSGRTEKGEYVGQQKKRYAAVYYTMYAGLDRHQHWDESANRIRWP